MARRPRYRGPLFGPGGEVWWPREPGRPRPGWRRGAREWAPEWEAEPAPARRRGRPGRGGPVRGFRSYDLDYGLRTGGPFEYSGRAGYPLPGEERDTGPHWPPPPDPYPWHRGTRVERVTGPYGARDRDRASHDAEYGAAYRRRPVYRPRRRPRFEHRHWSAAEPPGYERYGRPFDYW